MLTTTTLHLSPIAYCMHNKQDIENYVSPNVELLSSHERIYGKQNLPDIDDKETQTPPFNHPTLQKKLAKIHSNMQKFEKCEQAKKQNRCCKNTCYISAFGCICFLIGTAIASGGYLIFQP